MTAKLVLVLKLVAIAIALFLTGLITYRQEFAARHYLDTLRVERYQTTQLFGIPIARRLSSVQDGFEYAYVAIRGSEPRREHWL